mmetsp:Transcript_19013/g.42251  ORF Transcript_19013/g.42251 Transcript_19013/m.42251 type:complete len:368 (+) Transcript_19013:76-1179(+)
MVDVRVKNSRKVASFCCFPGVFCFTCICVAILVVVLRAQQRADVDRVVALMMAHSVHRQSMHVAPATEKGSGHKTGVGGIPWSSPHMVDCKAIGEEPSDIYVTTSTTPPFEMNIHDPEVDAYISGGIQKDGCWECDHIKGVQDALSSHPGAYFLDVGGNIGMWTLSVAASGRESYTIEPFPLNHQRMCKTINRNGFDDRTHVLAVAATSKPVSVALNVPAGERNLGGVRVVKQSGVNSGGNKSASVPGVPIDSLGLPTDSPVVMKVDVEGYEMEALEGAMNFLKNATLAYIAMELRPQVIRSHPKTREIFDLLSSQGLVPYRNDYDKETRLDPRDLQQWVHFKHPAVRYFDVTWRKEVGGQEKQTRA